MHTRLNQGHIGCKFTPLRHTGANLHGLHHYAQARKQRNQHRDLRGKRPSSKLHALYIFPNLPLTATPMLCLSLPLQSSQEQNCQQCAHLEEALVGGDCEENIEWNLLYIHAGMGRERGSRLCVSAGLNYPHMPTRLRRQIQELKYSAQLQLEKGGRFLA